MPAAARSHSTAPSLWRQLNPRQNVRLSRGAGTILGCRGPAAKLARKMMARMAAASHLRVEPGHGP